MKQKVFVCRKEIREAISEIRRTFQSGPTDDDDRYTYIGPQPSSPKKSFLEHVSIWFSTMI